MRRHWWWGLLLATALPSGVCAQVATTVDIGGLVSDPAQLQTLVFDAPALRPGQCTSNVQRCTGRVRQVGARRRIRLSRACMEALVPEAADEVSNWSEQQLVLSCRSNVSVTVTWASEAASISLSEDAATVNGSALAPPGQAEVVTRSRGRWAKLFDHSPATLRSHSVVFYRPTNTAMWRLTRVERVHDNDDNTSSNTGEAWCGAVNPERFCAAALGRVRQGACFVERAPNDLQLVQTSPDDHVIRVNTNFTVVACIASNHTLRGSLSGTPTLWDPAIDDQRDEAQLQGGESTSGGAPATLRLVRLSFAPRRPGALELVLKLHTATNTLVDEVQTELVVEQTYSGALRLGIGVPLFAVQREYTTELAPGSAQHEIVAGGSDVDVELVITFAGFLEALNGGRSYTRPGYNFFERWGLFVAAGVLAPSTEGVRFLTSFYVGVELEIIRSLSFGVGFVLRRVNRLISGYSVGDAVLDGTRLSGESWEPGLGFVIGVSPEFLQFAGALGDG